MVEKKTGFGVIFSNLGFMLLWLGQLTSQLADRIFVYVLMIIIYQQTRSNLGVSLPLLAFGIPSVLVGPWAGVLVDRLDRKGILVVTALLRGLLTLLIIPFLTAPLQLIFLISLLLYTMAQFFAPAETSSIPELVDKHNLIIANALFMMTWMASSVVGFGLGAPIVNLFAEKNTLIVSAALYFISATAVMLIPIRSRPTAGKSHVCKDLLVGFEFIRRHGVVRFSLIQLFAAASAIATLSLLAISYAGDVLKIGERNFGYLIIAVGVGMLIGMFTLERIRYFLKMGTIVTASFLLSGGLIVWLAMVKDLRLALVLITLLGVGNIYITSTIQTILQHRIPRQIRGRVFGVQNMLVNSAFTLPVVLFGWIADLAGITNSMAMLGWALLLVGVIGVLLPKLRRA
ncbi:MAG: MFS transporter [Candidatus Margulisbacteria bacterium]|nr:MFS transporter [Candidatus Margulisiibacteriota bacterium]MBU1617776.1 MFS transporter [Candidatus Margulisiibacteriota bacterium]